MLRREFLGRASQFFLATLFPYRSQASKISVTDEITRLAFGSCARQDEPQPIWNEIAKKNPDLFVFLGDNVYGDTEDMEELAKKYDQLGVIPEFADFRSKTPIIATWDDHDYGYNDAGCEHPRKFESKGLFLNFFGEPKASPRWGREGIYTSYYYGNSPNRVQVILLDLRWSRTGIMVDEQGCYQPTSGEGVSMLGDEQWAWFENELFQPADVRIIGSSIQMVSNDHIFEKWANFPQDKARLFKLIDENRLKNVFVISGDMHFGELSSETTPDGRVIFDLTSSGINRYDVIADWVPNTKRITIFDQDANFGLLSFDWNARNICLEVCDSTGTPVIKQDVALI